MIDKKLYLVKDGIDTSHIRAEDGKRVYNTNYYSVTFDLKRNEGYITKINESKWKLYTQVGQKINTSRYYFSPTFEGIVDKLLELSKDYRIVLINQHDLKNK